MTGRHRFDAVARLLHWVMAAMILAMLLIGVGMVSTVSERYHALLTIHRPLGIAILVLAAIRLLYRLFHPAPPMPAAMPAWQKLAAHASHVVLYALMLAIPLVGWAMLSAGAYPVVLYQALHLPPILPPSPTLYALLRQAHHLLAFLLFATVLAHFAAALMHALIFRDRVFASMASGRRSDEARR